MFKRVVLTLAAAALVLTLAVSALLWFVLARWVPVQGKALLIERLEQQWPIQVEIAGMRYGFLQGLLIDGLEVRDALDQATYAAAPSVRANVNWLDLAATRRVGFRSRVQLEAPCPTTLMISGRYGVRERDLTVRVASEEIARETITGPLAARLPAALTAGVFRVDVRYASSPASLPVLAGRAAGERVTWEQPPVTLTGQLEVEGTAEQRAPGPGGWHWDLDAQLRHGTVQGPLPIVTATDVSGRFHLTPEAIEIEPLRGRVLGTEWTADGTVTLRPAAAVELHAATRADLQTLADLAAPWLQGWKPDGTAPLDAVCRGPLQPKLFMDCAVQTHFDRARLNHPRLAQPLTELTGPVHYDVLARDLTLPLLRGKLGEQPLAFGGRVSLQAPLRLQGRLEGGVPLEAVAPWLPAASPLTGLKGLATVDVAVTGTVPALRYEGSVQLSHAAAALKQPPLTLEECTAELRLLPARIELPHATLRVNGQPLSLEATVELSEEPDFALTARLPQGAVEAAGRLTPTHALLDEAQLNLGRTQLRLRGALARTAQRASRLEARGVVQLEELAALPFLPLPALTAWEARGVVDITARLEGPLADLPAATLEARLQSPALGIRRVPLEQVRAIAHQEGGMLQIQIPAALLADGNLVGEMTFQHKPQGQTTFLAQADLVNVQLARLGEAIPTWKSREVSGHASLHVLMGGIAAQRASWEGEGWVNANGTQLGSVRILERVFQGLFGVMADQLGLDMLRRAEITQASVKWRLKDQRFFTEDLRLGGVAGTQPIALYGQGSVGFDQTLDMVIEPELSEGTLFEAPSTSSLAGAVLKAAGTFEQLRRLVGRHRLTGTVKNPDYRFEAGRQELLRPSSGAGLLQDILKKSLR